MNKSFNCLLLLVISLFASCEEKMDGRSETQCIQARFIARYACSSSDPLYLVELLSPTRLATQYAENDTANLRYYAAMFDLPESVHVVDTVFYMQMHRDPIRDSKVMSYCTANILWVNSLVCEGVLQSCP
jgi:hypothetical protein